MKVDGAKRVKELAANARLKKLLADAEFDKAILKELGGGRPLTPNRKRGSATMLQTRFGVSER